jgi:hypothetical protein
VNLKPVPFPFMTMFQNGPRRQAYAPQNLFNSRKDFPTPRPTRALLPAAGRSEEIPTRRERGQTQSPNHFQFAALCGLPLVGLELLDNFGVDKPS